MDDIKQKMNTGKKSGFGANVIKLVTGKASSQVIAILVMPVLTRLYVPSDFGIYEVFVSLTAVITIIASLRYEMAIMLPEKKEDAAILVSLSTVIVFIVSTISLVIVVFFRDYIANLMGTPELARFLWFAPLVIISGGLLHVFSFWSTRQKEFGRVAVSSVTTIVSASVTKLTVGLVGRASPAGLIGGQILGNLIGTIVLIARSFKHDWFLFKQGFNIKKMKFWAGRYKRFPFFSSWSAFLNTLSANLPMLLLAYFFSPVIVGYYGLGRKVVGAPLNLVALTVGKVFFQKVSEEKNKGENIGLVIESIFKRLISIGLFPMLILMVSGQDIFKVIFGDNWITAGIYVQILSLWMFVRFLYVPMSTIFTVLEKQPQALAFNITKFFLILTAIITGGVIGNPVIAVFLISLTGSLYSLWLCLYILRMSEVPVKRSLRFFGFEILKFSPFMAFLLLLKYLNVPSLFVVIVAGLTGFIYLFLVVFRDKELRRIISFFPRGKDNQER